MMWVLGTVGFLMVCGSVVAARQAVSSDPAVEPAIFPKPVVSWVFSPNVDQRPAGTAIDTLVIHGTRTPGVEKAQTIARHFANPRSGVSAHYIIGKAGEIVQCVPHSLKAWHAGPSRFQGKESVNAYSIGIELVNDDDGQDPFTDAQYASLVDLTAYLVSRYAIPLSRITGHRDVITLAGVRTDPGDNFDWDRYLKEVAGSIPDRPALLKVAESHQSHWKGP